MDKLQLAMLTRWAEDAGLPGIQSRKRMQKVVYFLQQAGCPISAEYTLHHYGPYSRDVANVTDVMVAEGLLEELGGGGGQYDYKLSPQTRPMIDLTRARHAEAARAFDAFRDRAVELLRQDLWLLELGSTILYYRTQSQNGDWERALIKACEFKRVDRTGRSLAALELAKRHAAA
jgi:uncharacterized protein YwgA